MNNANSFTKFILTILIVFFIIITTSLGTIKILNHYENLLLDNEIKQKIGVENFEELDRIETKIFKTSKYYSKDGSLIIESREESDGTTNYNQ